VSIAMQRTTRNNIQILYGIALVLMGIGVFYRIPQMMPELARIGQFAGSLWVIRGCFYFMGIILIGGGIRKIYLNFRPNASGQSHDGS
jgi:hypothetical protein